MDMIEKRQTVFGMIFILANKFQKKCDGMLEDLTIRQFMLLILMKNRFAETASLKELADIYGCTRQNIKQIIDVLIRKNFLAVSPSLEDKREVSVSLTEYAYSYFENNEDKGNQILANLFFGIEDEELDIAQGVMQKLLKIVEGGYNE